MTDLEKVEAELEKLLLIDKKLIQKKHTFETKLEMVDLSSKNKKDKLAKFMDEYLTRRLKVGLLRSKWYEKKQDIIGAPKSLKNFDDTILDKMVSSV